MTDRDDGRLPRAAEAMLRGWPAPPRRDAYWEGRAEAVLVELRHGDPDDIPEELLEPPLPAEAAEGSLDEWMRSPPSQRASLRPAIRLADLARATVENEGGDDRLAVAKQTLSHAVRARQVAAVAAGPARPANEVDEAEELTEADEIEVSEPAQAAAVRRRRRRRKRSNLVLIVGSTVGFLGFAAGALIFLYTIQHPIVRELASVVGVKLPALPAEPPTPTAVALAPTTETPARGRPSAPAEVAHAAEPRSSEAKPGSEGPQMVAAAPKGAGRASAAKKEEKKPSEEGDKVAVNEEPEEPPPAAAPTEPEPKKTEPKKPEPETYSDRLPPAHDESRPLEPSTGAAMAAIQAVMPNARSCLAGQSAPSSATVTFGSDGRVQSVVVSGPPANSGAAACIRVALSSARVSPFAKPTFSIPATVRPP